MNKFYLTILAALSLAANAQTLSAPGFLRESALAKGKWVKIGVESSGVYEISYEALRRMGFAKPENVTLFGRGGHVMDIDLLRADGTSPVNDDLKPVKVWHHNNKIYFYGNGTEKISLRLTSGNEYLTSNFERESKNIYSDRGYYFLTDSRSAEPMPVSATPAKLGADVEKIERCMAYRYHETDLEHNFSRSGQIFWGESLKKAPGGTLTWPINVPEAVADVPGMLNMQLYLSSGYKATFNYGIQGGGRNATFEVLDDKSTDLTPVTPKYSMVNVPAGKQSLYVNFQGAEGEPEYCNLDYWLLSYQSGIPQINDTEAYRVAHSRFAVTDLTSGSDYVLEFSGGDNVVIDISDPDAPRLFTGVTQGDGNLVKISTGNSSYLDLVAFNPERPQLQISGYEEGGDVANQNLHQYAEEGADLLIITVPAMLGNAERIASLHREKEGLKVVVATTEECYNEFSQGVPDPMAYRLLAKMLYSGKTKLRNLLLIGPLYADFRGVDVAKDPKSGIIAYQHADVSIEHHAYNANDFYGMMSDKLKHNTLLERNSMEVGVGVLPLRFQSEADIYIEKIRKHLEDDTWAYRLNKQLNMGGEGDNHTHDRQADELGYWINNITGNTTICYPLIADCYDYAGARNKLLEEINAGQMVWTYYGHGAETMLGKNFKLFTTNHVMKMTNDKLPFVCFAGCSLSNSDRGRIGMGEKMVTSTPHGAIGALLATRSTWSGQNQQFYHSLFRNIYQTADIAKGERRTSMPTIGELVAATKTSSSYSNKMSYQLVCDPALRFPFATATLQLDADAVLTANSGDDVEISGYVSDFKGQINSDFNGEIVARLMEPSKVLRCQQLLTKDDKQEPLDITYKYVQAGMGVAKVENGRFKLKLHVPGYTRQFNGATAGLHLAAYDPAAHTGAMSAHTFSYKAAATGEQTAETLDKTAPVIETLALRDEHPSVYVKVTDETALNLAMAPIQKGFNLWLNGRELLSGSDFTPHLLDSGKAYELNIPLGNIAAGEYCIKARVKDAAGNMTEREITALYVPGQGKYALTLGESTPASELIEFGFEGASPAKGRLVILDASGREVYSKSFSGSLPTWDRTTGHGLKAAPGHYKAYVIEEGNGQTNGHSATIDVPLI